MKDLFFMLTLAVALPALEKAGQVHFPALCPPL
jgi:hypothetical protein